MLQRCFSAQAVCGTLVAGTEHNKRLPGPVNSEHGRQHTLPAGRWHAPCSLVLFLILFLSLPVPLYLADLGWVPPARIAQLALHMLLLLAAERVVTVTLIITTAFVVQALLYGLLSLLLARWLGERLARAAKAWRWSAALLAGIWLIVAASTPVYRDLFLPVSSSAGLLSVYR